MTMYAASAPVCSFHPYRLSSATSWAGRCNDLFQDSQLATKSRRPLIPFPIISTDYAVIFMAGCLSRNYRRRIQYITSARFKGVPIFSPTRPMMNVLSFLPTTNNHLHRLDLDPVRSTRSTFILFPELIWTLSFPLLKYPIGLSQCCEPAPTSYYRWLHKE